MAKGNSSKDRAGPTRVVMLVDSGKKTRGAYEDVFWNELRAIAQERNISLPAREKRTLRPKKAKRKGTSRRAITGPQRKDEG